MVNEDQPRSGAQLALQRCQALGSEFAPLPARHRGIQEVESPAAEITCRFEWAAGSGGEAGERLGVIMVSGHHHDPTIEGRQIAHEALVGGRLTLIGKIPAQDQQVGPLAHRVPEDLPRQRIGVEAVDPVLRIGGQMQVRDL